MQIVDGFLRPGLKNGSPGDEVAAHPRPQYLLSAEDRPGILCSNPLQRRRRPRHSKDQDSQAVPPAGPTGGGASAGSALGLPRGRGGRRPPQVQCKMDMVYTQRLCGRCPWLLSSVRSPGVCMHGTPPAVGSSTTGISAGSARTQDARSLVGQSCVSSFLQGELRGLVGAKL